MSTMFRQAGRAIVLVMFCALGALYLSDLSASTDHTKPPRVAVQKTQPVLQKLNVPPPPPPPPPGPPPKVCHCADSCGCHHDCWPQCTCVVAQDHATQRTPEPTTFTNTAWTGEPEPDYPTLRAKAISENAPLIVWVGTRNPAIEQELAECQHVHVDAFPGAQAPCIVVSRPVAGDLYRLADLPATASAFRIGQATVPPTPEAPPVETPAPVPVPVVFRPVEPRSMAFRPRPIAAACST